MKYTIRHLAALATVAAMLVCMNGCTNKPYHGETLHNTAVGEDNKAALDAPIPLSGFEDVTDKKGVCTYQMRAALTDTYTFMCERATSLTVKTPTETVEGDTKVQVAVNEGDTVTVTVKAEAQKKVQVTAQADNHLARLPYTPNFTVDPTTLDTHGNNTDATKIEYQKREGGTYVYLNNPEKLQPADIGQAILRDEGLSGDVQVTWEHSNFTGQYITLGYQLKNDGEDDVYVTVTNIGYQVQGEWLGQRSWSDYYNIKFELPEDYFVGGGVNERYIGQDFIDYTPRVFQPTTYRIPAGEYIWLVGGTSTDAYNDTNVAQTANKVVLPGKCTNAVAKCFITGGAVTGTFYCYTDAEQVKAEPEEQGYIIMRDGEQYGYQYKGVDHHTALIESNPVFYLNDSTVEGRSLPVTYTYEQADNIWWGSKIPYEKLLTKTKTTDAFGWTTNICPHGRGAAVGTDMSSFECATVNGDTVTLDVNHRDGTGESPNFGNWMIDYHDNMTFVNQSDTTKRVTINKSAQGAMMTMVLDPEGNVLSTRCTIVPLEESPDYRHWQLYTVEVPPHATVQVNVSFLLMGNSYGAVYHWLTVE